MLKQAYKDQRKCYFCGICENYMACAVKDLFSEKCIGCGACTLACPYDAISLKEHKRELRYIKIYVDGEKFEVPERISVKNALEYCGYEVGKIPESKIFAPCEVGGCYCCSVVIENELKQSCVTPVNKEMDIKTNTDGYELKRVVSGFSPHAVGGVGTPYYLKSVIGYVEAAAFFHGCVFRCKQCQNNIIAFTGNFIAMKPKEVALQLTKTRRTYRVDRMAFSGGECTLNQEFLLQSIRELKKLNQDEKARFHVDTNGAILTPSYILELIEAGMTDIGIDLKAFNLDTFIRITGVEDKELAKYYCKNAWNAVKYIIDNIDEVFLGIGIPYNRDLVSLEEIEQIGEKIASMSPDVQVCVLDYRPEFKRMNINRPTFIEMVRVKDILNSVGLNTVIAQTVRGHIGP
ncbi:MAG TPA: radical SAM protein [Methanosarcinales archaeon]|nr:radical SAM protein [Methanosarcinales archaeon]